MKERILFGVETPLGAALAKIWARQGDRLTIVGGNVNFLGDLAKDLQARGASMVEILQLDMNDLAELQRHTVELFKDKPRVDALVMLQDSNFANLPRSSPGYIDELNKMIRINLTSVAVILAAAQDHFVRNSHGVIAGLSSPGGEGWLTDVSLVSATRAGVANLLEGYRQKLVRNGVQVTSIVIKANEAVEIAALDIASQIGKSELAAPNPFWRWIFALNRIFPLRFRSNWFSALR